VHCSLNINTETGRLSCRRPNRQNQPALEKDRDFIRKAFRAAQGNKLVVADYGQLELRILAHMADCRSMIDAFASGGDFHSRTAAGMFDFIQVRRALLTYRHTRAVYRVVLAALCTCHVLVGRAVSAHPASPPLLEYRSALVAEPQSFFHTILRIIDEPLGLLQTKLDRGELAVDKMDPNYKEGMPLVKDEFASERRKAKILNFSLAYGKTEFGLSKDFGVDLPEARDIVERWYLSRPEVRCGKRFACTGGVKFAVSGH
jgi:DNA polymerase family A